MVPRKRIEPLTNALSRHYSTTELPRQYMNFTKENREQQLIEEFEEEQIKVEIGDQSDLNFLKFIVDKYGPFDIIIDDGPHTFDSQLKCLELYLCVLL